MQSNHQLANEKLQMFTTLLKITQTDQLLHQYGLRDLKELSAQGALLVIKLFTDVPVSKQQPGESGPLQSGYSDNLVDNFSPRIILRY